MASRSFLTTTRLGYKKNFLGNQTSTQRGNEKADFVFQREYRSIENFCLNDESSGTKKSLEVNHSLKYNSIYKRYLSSIWDFLILKFHLNKVLISMVTLQTSI